MNQEINNDECQMSSGCKLARAYVPFQILNQVYSPREALQRGTLFPDLYMPYIVEDMNTGGKYYE